MKKQEKVLLAEEVIVVEALNSMIKTGKSVSGQACPEHMEYLKTEEMILEKSPNSNICRSNSKNISEAHISHV
jgi:hypothetical protein